jgi:hypothetical protein
MKITRRQLRRIIKETYVGEEKWDAYQGYRGPSQNHKMSDFDPRSVAAAEIAVEKVGYPQGGMIEDEIHRYLEALSDITDDDLWRLADEALSVAGIMLDVGPDTL